MRIRLALLGATFAALGAAGGLSASPSDGVQFSKADRAAIVAYYDAAERARHQQARDEGHGHGHGKAHGRKDLPPGIQRQLARGKPLPPGLATRALPHDLLANLKPPRDHEVVLVDGRVMLVDARTRLVRDLIEGVIYR